MDSEYHKCILLVEDEALLGMFEKNQLEREGYSVLHVYSGEDALDIVLKQKRPIDLILMDIDLGNGIDGTSAATEILKEIQLPIVFLSSHTEREIVQKTETITSYGYVVKNSGITILDASIKMAFKLFEANVRNKRKREHLETVLRSIGDAVIATDNDGKVQRMNPVAEKLTGWKLHEVAGKNISEIFQIINAHTRNQVENPVDIVLKTNKTVGLANHTILIAKDGTEYQIADSGSPIKDLNGDTQGVVLVFRDVTEDYEIQSKIAYQANILDNVMDSVIATDENTRITYWNKAASRIYGWEASEVMGQLSKDILKTEFLNLSREEAVREIHTKGNYFGEVRQPRKDGSIVEVEVNTILLKDLNGKESGYVAVARDISERKLSLQRVFEFESKLTQIIETAMDAVISIDKNKKVILFNQAAETMFGYTAAERIGKSLDDLLPLDMRISHDQKIDEFAKTGISRRAMGELGHIHGVRANGEVFPIEASISQIEINHEKLFTVILRDESIRFQNEKKIQALLMEKENILKEIHHRMKNNMASIFNLLSMKADDEDNETTKSVLLQAAGRVKAMAILYEKLYYSETNNSVAIKDYFPAILQEIVEIFPLDVKLNINITEREISLPAKVLSSFGIILNELITNSMKHAFVEKQLHQIDFEFTYLDEKIRILYHDNGIQIPESISLQKSSGFGLQLVSMLVEQIGGVIEIGRGKNPKFTIEWSQ